MKVCVIRNSEAKSNAGIIRIVDALIENHEIITLTRNRDTSNNNHFERKDFFYHNKNIINYELQLYSEMAKGLNNIFNLLRYQILTFKWLVKNKKDFEIIHSFDLDAGLPSLIAAKLLRKKIVYHIADFYVDSRSGIPDRLKNFIRKLEYFIIDNAEATIICTEDRKLQIEGSEPRKLEVIHNTPVNLKNELSSDSKRDKFTLCYVGGLSRYRFINEILDICSEIPEMQLNIAGFGELSEKVKMYSKKYDNINYMGRIDYDQAIDLYKNCDCMFAMYDPKHPNHKYSAPNKVYEAMLLNKPILVAHNTGVDKIVLKENVGLVIDYSEEAFKKSIIELMNNKNRIKDIINRTEVAKEKYSWENMKIKLLELYDEV